MATNDWSISVMNRPTHRAPRAFHTRVMLFVLQACGQYDLRFFRLGHNLARMLVCVRGARWYHLLGELLHGLVILFGQSLDQVLGRDGLGCAAAAKRHGSGGSGSEGIWLITGSQGSQNRATMRDGTAE